MTTNPTLQAIIDKCPEEQWREDVLTNASNIPYDFEMDHPWGGLARIEDPEDPEDEQWEDYFEAFMATDEPFDTDIPCDCTVTDTMPLINERTMRVVYLNDYERATY